VETGLALPLAGGKVAFSLVRLIDEDRIVSVSGVPPEFRAAVANLAQPPASWSGLPSDRPLVMGIVNVTPDSFSDGGDHFATTAAIAAGQAMIDAGADIVDIGGESTRPGAAVVPVAKEQGRVLPVVCALAARTVVSIDTRNAATMEASLDAGARIVNDVSALSHDPAARPAIAARDCGVILMHMRGEPATMMRQAQYDDVAVEVTRELATRLAEAEAAGIERSRIAVDPGIGFAKNDPHSVELLQRLGILMNLGCPIVLGASRKGFIGRLSGETEARRRAPGSIAVGLHALLHGAWILRVHDVAETVQAVRVWHGLTLGAMNCD
jgi:dihydropteroate synthase